MAVKKWVNEYTIILALVAVAFFCVTSYHILAVWLPYYQQLGHIIYSWPDAMANQAFIQHFVDYGTFRIPVSDNPGNVIHPRSVNVVFGDIVPMTFLGMLLIYGYLGGVVGTTGIFFLTPLFGAVALFLFYGLIKRLLGKSSALITTILLATLAPWLYYSTLVMLHTVLFISIAIIGFWFLTHHGVGYRGRFNTQYAFIALGGLILGLALTVRTVEAPWVLWIAFVFFIVSDKQKWLKGLVALFFLIIPFIPVLWHNQSLYGQIFTVGYLNMDITGTVLDRLPTEFDVRSTHPLIKAFKAIVLPFGFSPRTMITVVMENFIRFFGPYLVLSSAGLVWYLTGGGKKSKKITAYIFAAAGTVIWLMFYYGNWLFADSDVLRYNTIGSSYMRYFLPAYIMILPGVAYLLDQVRKSSLKKWISGSCIAIVLVGLGFYSWQWAYAAPRDGLITLRDTYDEYYQTYQAVTKIVPADSIIIVDKTDKILWPTYDVVMFLGDRTIFPRLNILMDRDRPRPIYHLTMLGDEAMDIFNQELRADYQLQFGEPITVDPVYRLFPLERVYE